MNKIFLKSCDLRSHSSRVACGSKSRMAVTTLINLTVLPLVVMKNGYRDDGVHSTAVIRVSIFRMFGYECRLAITQKR